MATLSTLKRKNGLTSFQIQFFLTKKRKTLSLGSLYTRKQTERIKAAVEDIADAIETGGKIGKATAGFIADMTDDLKARFVACGLIEESKTKTAKALWCAFSQKSRGRKMSTMLTYENAEKRFLAFFSPDTPVDSITVEDGEDYREWLEGEGLAEAQIAKLIAKTRTVFNWGVDRGYIERNVFLKVKRGSYENQSREFYVTPDDYLKLLDACPNREWRVFLSLMRIGGLRFCEAQKMTWENLEQADNPGMMKVISPKTEHHSGKGQRNVPIFKEIQLEVNVLKLSVSHRQGYLMPSLADESAQLLRKKMLQIVKRAGLTPWQRLFHNLRGSRANELFRRFNVFDASRWVGQSVKTAAAYYVHQNVPDVLDNALSYRVCETDTAETTAQTTAKCGQNG